jgi:hypothetical protein
MQLLMPIRKKGHPFNFDGIVQSDQTPGDRRFVLGEWISGQLDGEEFWPPLA